MTERTIGGNVKGPGEARRGSAMRRLGWTAGVLMAVLAAAAPAAAQERQSPDVPESDAAKKAESKGKPAKAEDVPLYTNEDLDRLGPDPYAPKPEKPAAPEAAPGTEAAKAAADPLRELEDDLDRAAGLAAQTAAAARAVSAAEAAVREIEKRALAVRNPFLPPPVPPPERAEAWAKMSGDERAAVTDEDLQEAKRRLEDAKARLAQLRAGATP